MIHEAAVLMESGGSSEDLGHTCHARRAMSEAVKEAAFATFFKPIHMGSDAAAATTDCLSSPGEGCHIGLIRG